MSKRLDGTSMFTGINSALTNTFSQLSNQYSDGLTMENLNKALTNSPLLTNSNYGATFTSYLSNNFSSIDKNGDGQISADEIQNLMSTIATQGLTREQITSLCGVSGFGTSLQETVLSHFDDIDTNHDGRVTNSEIQAYGVNSQVEKQKIANQNRIINNMSLYYDNETDYEGSLLDYKYLDDNKGS